jgi:hypothetical protein
LNKETIVAQFEVLSRKTLGKTREYHEKSEMTNSLDSETYTQHLPSKK